MIAGRSTSTDCSSLCCLPCVQGNPISYVWQHVMIQHSNRIDARPRDACLSLRETTIAARVWSIPLSLKLQANLIELHNSWSRRSRHSNSIGSQYIDCLLSLDHTLAEMPSRLDAVGTGKLRESCNSCSALKIRCSKARPSYGRCAARNIECNYSISMRNGRPARSAPKVSDSSAGRHSGTKTWAAVIEARLTNERQEFKPS